MPPPTPRADAPGSAKAHSRTRYNRLSSVLGHLRRLREPASPIEHQSMGRVVKCAALHWDNFRVLKILGQRGGRARPPRLVKFLAVERPAQKLSTWPVVRICCARSGVLLARRNELAEIVPSAFW